MTLPEHRLDPASLALDKILCPTLARPTRAAPVPGQNARANTRTQDTPANLPATCYNTRSRAITPRISSSYALLFIPTEINRAPCRGLKGQGRRRRAPCTRHATARQVTLIATVAVRVPLPGISAPAAIPRQLRKRYPPVRPPGRADSLQRSRREKPP